MSKKKIHILGDEDVCYMFGLLGMEGTIVEENKNFMEKFKTLTEDPSISLIIISGDFPDNIIDYLIEFKLNNREPFIFYLPNIFKEEIEERGVLLKNVYKSLDRLLS